MRKASFTLHYSHSPPGNPLPKNRQRGYIIQLAWEEVNERLRIGDFNIHTVPARISEVGDLFGEVLGEGIDMGEVLRMLD